MWSGSTWAPYSVPCSSSLCWMPCHVSSTLEFPGRNYANEGGGGGGGGGGALDMERSRGEEVEGKAKVMI